MQMHNLSLNSPSPAIKSLTPSSTEFLSAVLSASHRIRAPWLNDASKTHQKTALILQQIHTALNDASSILEMWDQIHSLSKGLSGGLFDFLFISDDSPRGYMEAVLKRYPKEQLLAAAFHDQQKELKVLHQNQEQQANRLNETERQQGEIRRLLKENKELKFRIAELEQGLNEVERELDDEKLEKEALQDKLHEAEQKQALYQRVLTPTEEELLALKLENFQLKKAQEQLKKERDLAKPSSLQGTAFSQSAPSTQRFLRQRSKLKKEEDQGRPAFTVPTFSASTAH